MNYTGGKSKILDFLLGLFPKGIHRFYDLFCGGLNVSLNAECQSVVSNDLNSRLIGIYEYIASFKDFDELEAEILKFGPKESEKPINFTCYGRIVTGNQFTHGM